MTGLMRIGLEDAFNPTGRGARRRWNEPTWRWHRVDGAGRRFRLQPPGGHTASESDVAIRTREHLDYLTRMAVEGVVPPNLVTKAKAVWKVARISVGSLLPIPAAAAFLGGPVEYHWSVGPHQLSAEIPADGLCHWTYRNGNTGELWGEETADEGLPSRLIRALARIAESSR